MALGFEKFDDLEKILPEQLKISGRKLQCLVCGIILLLMVICIILSVSLGLHAGGKMGKCSSQSHANKQWAGSGACATTECLETAARLLENMDTTVDPCDDFYRYSCGGWTKRHTVAPDAGDITVRKKLQLENDERIREIIEKPVQHDGPDSSERKLKQFFRMCVHDYGRMKEGGKMLWSLIRKHAKGWYGQDPDNWMSNGWNLNEAISDIQGELNAAILLRISIGLDWRTKSSMIRIYTGGTGMFYRYYIREDQEGVQEAYKDYMRQLAVLLMRDANVTMTTSEQNRRVEQFVSDAYGQELHLAQILSDINTSRDMPKRRTRIMTMSQLESNYTQLPWRQMIRRSFEGFDVVSSTKVRVSAFGYFEKVNELLRNETSNKDRIMNNYIVWRVLFMYSRYLSWEYKNAAYRYYEMAYGRREFPATWEECVQLTKRNFGSALAVEFLRNYANKETKQKVEKMYKYIKVALFNSIENLRWMDNETKARAEEKLQINMTDGFFKSYVNAQRFQRYFRAKELQGGGDAMWSFLLAGGSGGSAASYFWRTNYLMVPPGAMQFPFFDHRSPEFFNFGGLGTQIADEISSSINQLGRYIWTNGSWANWWTADTQERYTEAKDCFSNYFDGMQVGPYLINGENQTTTISGRYQSKRAIDTVAGIRTAFTAYHNWISESGSQLIPVGLSLTTDQAFFVATAQTQCFVRKDELAYNYIRYQYIPENVLHNGALSHMPEFADVFACGSGTRMVANDTCRVF
ncbi:hypothetical protein LSH36_70g07011 [Paralvinella palmiformis]|uniref:Uncharacterized protein n=1 Tax=Paralvinella palmiformis TaxID=53620 RepID=A0AAD9K349_9ANNE|nr:hypothetical protein LSH36_70g07011 [Paralvinella palmiformis]